MSQDTSGLRCMNWKTFGLRCMSQETSWLSFMIRKTFGLMCMSRKTFSLRCTSQEISGLRCMSRKTFGLSCLSRKEKATERQNNWAIFGINCWSRTGNWNDLKDAGPYWGSERILLQWTKRQRLQAESIHSICSNV